jgi:chemotaxis protein CheD
MMADLMARMAEIVASQTPGDVLVALGLGSCIGVALLDDSGGVGALAHVVLPSSNGAAGAAKFADTAVPLLIDEMAERAVSRHRLWAVFAGGAQMFSLGAGGNLDIGRRNEAAVRAALDANRIPVRATATGGSVGRTLRVYLGSGRVTSREAGGAEVDLLPLRARATTRVAAA